MDLINYVIVSHTKCIGVDILQKFFDIIRSHCGTHDHPNSVMFIQIYRLLSEYALIKPPKNTNVGSYGETVAHTLLDLKSISTANTENEDKKTNFYLMLDEVVDAGVPFSNLSEIIDIPHAVHYFAGYIARKAITFTECHLCIQTLISDKNEEMNSESLIALRDKFNVLIYPSAALGQMTTVVENVILETVSDGVVRNTPLECTL